MGDLDCGDCDCGDCDCGDCNCDCNCDCGSIAHCFRDCFGECKECFSCDSDLCCDCGGCCDCCGESHNGGGMFSCCDYLWCGCCNDVAFDTRRNVDHLAHGHNNHSKHEVYRRQVQLRSNRPLESEALTSVPSEENIPVTSQPGADPDVVTAQPRGDPPSYDEVVGTGLGVGVGGATEDARPVASAPGIDIDGSSIESLQAAVIEVNTEPIENREKA